MEIVQGWNWFVNQNLAVQALVIIGVLNSLVAGFKAMGWTYLADECQKVENAIAAMLGAAKSSVVNLMQKKGQ